jgi:hypothetical protein
MGVVRRFAVAGLVEASRRCGRRAGLAIGALDETARRRPAAPAALLKPGTDTQAAPPVRLGQPPPADPGLVPLTVAETARLLSRPARPLRALAEPETAPPSARPLAPPARPAHS